MKTSDILNRAAEVMMERGHTKGKFVDDEGRVCLMGALNTARTGSPKIISRDIAADRILCRVIWGMSNTSIAHWNDRPSTTEAMAIGALYKAALLAKEQGE